MKAESVLSRRYRVAAMSVAIILLFAIIFPPAFASSARADAPECHVYTVTATAVGGHGTVSPATQSVKKNKTASINIYPDTGFHIQAIVDNEHAMPISSPYVIEKVRANHHVYVTFGTDRFDVNARVDGGHGRVNPEHQVVAYGGTASVDLAADSGYKLGTITDNGSSMPLDDPYVIANVTANHDVVVTFVLDHLTVNASVHGGHGAVSPATQSVVGGGTAAVQITPNAGYTVASITDNGVVMPISTPYVITNVTKDHTVVVTFGVKQYTVTATAADAHGTVAPATQTVIEGGSASIDITASTGWKIDAIIDNGVSVTIADPYVINNVTANHNVVVSFVVDHYAVNASVQGTGGTVAPPTQSIEYNFPATIALTPQDGTWSVATITDNGQTIPGPYGSTYQIDHVTKNHDVVVTFKQTNFMVNALVVGGHGTVDRPTQIVAPGNPSLPITFTATDPGYSIATMTDNGAPVVPVVNPYTEPPVFADHTIVVTYKKDTLGVTATVLGPGGTALPATQPVAYDGTANINITPAAGYHIFAIIDDHVFKPLPPDPTVPYVYPISNVKEDHAVYVVFDNNTYTVTAVVTGGHGQVSPPTQDVSYHDSATVDIIPDPGYHLATIVDNSIPVVSPTDPYVIDNVDVNHNVVVTFAINDYTVDASAEGGNGTVAPLTQGVTAGGTAAINIVAREGYHIETITDNDEFVTLSNPYILTGILENHDVVVTFAINEYVATADVAGGNGAVDPQEQSVVYGDTAVFDLFPDYGYHPATIIDNGDSVAVTNPYFISDTTDDHNVTVVFAYDESPVFYLAEGSTAHGFSTYLSIENPNAQALNAEIAYMLSNGTTAGQIVGLPALSQVTVNPAIAVGAADFSTQVTCVQGKTIAVDRTMTWTGPGAPSGEGHSSVGVTAPETTWYLPEGCSGFGFETWTLVDNPNNTDTNVTLTYMIEGQGPKAITRLVPAHTRASYSMVTDIGPQNASIEVDSDLPVVAERSMYRDNRREGSNSIGTEVPSESFYLAEGSTAWGFTSYVLVQNPNEEKATVTLTCMTPTGAKVLRPFVMEPQTRKTLRMNDLLPNTDFSTMVAADMPIIAERAMYWGRGTPLGEACHDSIGLDEPHANFYLPDGQTSDGRETFALVANPNDTPVQVMVSYLFSDGTGASYFIATIPANSRATYNMSSQLPSGRASIAVSCLTHGKKILAERSMYWNGRGAGTDTVGDWSH